MRVRNLDSTGSLLDGVTLAAGDIARIDQVIFAIEDDEELTERARKLAVQDMMDKAKSMAGYAGVGLGELEFLKEIGRAAPASPMMRMQPSSGPADTSTCIPPSELVSRVTVHGHFSTILENRNT